MNIFGQECKEPTTVIITKTQAIEMIKEYFLSFMKDEKFIMDCIVEGCPCPLNILKKKPLVEYTIQEIIDVMEESGIMDMITDPDVVLVAENDKVAQEEFCRSVVVR